MSNQFAQFPVKQSVFFKLQLFFFTLLTLIGLFLRFHVLSQIPVSLYYDEMDYVFTGEAVARFGTDIVGSWRPWQLVPLLTWNRTAELPAFFHALTQQILGLGVGSAHYPAAIFGLLTCLLSGFLAGELSKSKKAALCVSLALLITPWHIHLSRMGYEAVIALFFQLLFLYAVIKVAFTENRKPLIGWLLICALSLFFTFFLYHATKFSMIPVVLISAFFLSLQRSLRLMKVGGSVALTTVLILCLAWTMSASSSGVYGERSSELIFDVSSLNDKVQQARLLTIDSPVENLLVNKATIVVREAVKHYVYVFDLYRMFGSGMESTGQFSLIVHSFFYLSQLILIPIGAYLVWKKFPQYRWFLLSIFIVSPLASAITQGYQSIFRSALTYFLLACLSGLGVWFLIERFKRTASHFVLLSVLFLIMVGETLFFSYQYFSQYPAYAADNHYIFEELLAAYVGKEEIQRAAQSNFTQREIVIVSEEAPYTKMRSIVAYLGWMPQLTLEERQQFSAPRAKEMRVKSIYGVQGCVALSAEKTYLIERKLWKECGYDRAYNQPFLYSISSPINSEAYYYIVNDVVCQNQELNQFIFIKKLSEYNPVQQSIEKFCTSWVKRETL